MFTYLKKQFLHYGHNHRAKTKTVTWRIIASTDTFLLSMAVIHFFPELGTGGIAGAIATAEVLNKLVLYWAHERLWQNVSRAKSGSAASRKSRVREIRTRIRGRRGV